VVPGAFLKRKHKDEVMAVQRLIHVPVQEHFFEAPDAEIPRGMLTRIGPVYLSYRNCFHAP
jgi:hypothetical protein